MPKQLERKVKYFLSSHYRGRAGVREALDHLLRFGSLALVGGMLRDISLFGNAGFKSDLDFVIIPYDLDEFDQYMTFSGAKRNRFGGYGISAQRWQIDVWPLQKSWAHVNGHVKINTINDLRKATFFNCDAIVYNVEHGNVRSHQGYFDDLDRKILEINLEPNPNPIGSSVRALRYALIKGFAWGPKLSSYVEETIDAVGWNALCEGEFRSFGTSYLDTLEHLQFMDGLRVHMASADNAFFDPKAYRRDVQLTLPHLFS